MRKFKVKNRQKRKYIRRKSMASSSHIPGVVTPGFFLTIFVELLLLYAILAITKSPIDKSILPSIHMSHMVYSILTPVQNAINFFANVFHLPKVPQISLPGIDFSAITSPLQALWQFISNLMTGIIHIFLTATQLVIVAVVDSLNNAASAMTQAFSSVLQFIVNLLWQLGVAIITVIRSVIGGIIWLITTILKSISEMLVALENAIAAPFRLIGNLFSKLKPTIDFISLSFKRSVSDLNINFGDIFSKHN